MITALTDGVTKEDGATPADPFDYGSGRVDLNGAGLTSVTMDETGTIRSVAESCGTPTIRAFTYRSWSAN